MTIIRMITLRNILICCCAAMLILIGMKGYNIQQKISTVTEADRLYALKDLIEAESWYDKAQRNHSIHYKEEQISSRLQELAPITKINTQLREIDDQAENAYSDQDFKQLMTVYRSLQDVRSIYMTGKSPYEPYYRQLSAKYEISEDFTRYFKQFKTLFIEQMEHNLDNNQYADESFKWNLLIIPDIFFGDGKQKRSELYVKFTTYDNRKMARMAANGEFQALLDQSAAMFKLYKDNNVQAKWITDQAETLVRTFLENDAEKDSYSIFATHAKSYMDFVRTVSFKSSVKTYIEKQISTWMKTAKRNVSKAEFEKAFAIYDGIKEYKDTSLEVKEAKLAWNIHDPIRILQNGDPTRVFNHVSSGNKRYGALVYVVATDAQNVIYFGTIDSENNVQVLTNTDFQQGGSIQELSIENSLSTKEHPVILIKGDSTTRSALYTAVEVQSNAMITLFQLNADGFQVDSSGILMMTNPDTAEGAGQVAMYERTGDSYQFVGVQRDFIDIAVEDLLSHPDEKVRFITTIIQPGYNEAFAVMGTSYVKLTGTFNFYEGNVTLTGKLRGYEDTYIQDQLTSIPVFEVENIE
ncbi:hypothetical protein [Paenibacillus glacialis]|uniref:Uncharacterized protein n=1 Tax=Paenibacillus glacialis TaxID=494026 RepID=A0A168MZZ9_9BACL|nr:hypothetical protein [Paenibacillus glacialis]OAB45239.1 hypothetical protein PGLA_02975 [Paenibacillus glacialis]